MSEMSLLGCCISAACDIIDNKGSKKYIETCLKLFNVVCTVHHLTLCV